MTRGVLLPLALLAAGCGLFGSDDMAVGSCLVRGEADEDGRTSVALAACDRPHDLEVVGLLRADEFEGEFPGEDPLSRWAFQQCIEAFEDYVGEPYGRSTLELDIAAPDEEQWQAGNRQVRCSVMPLDGQQRSSSVTS